MGLRQDSAMTETSWERLHRLIRGRLDHLGITQGRIHEIGGPSTAWIRDLKTREGQPTAKMAGSLADLDTALGWPAGTSWRLARDPFEPGSPAAEDEEDRLVNGDESTTVPTMQALPSHEEEIRHFQSLVGARLRALPEKDAKAAMKRITKALGL